jgi:hypothetical protein
MNTYYHKSCTVNIIYTRPYWTNTNISSPESVFHYAEFSGHVKLVNHQKIDYHEYIRNSSNGTKKIKSPTSLEYECAKLLCTISRVGEWNMSYMPF